MLLFTVRWALGISIINHINSHCQLVDPVHAELRHLKWTGLLLAVGGRFWKSLDSCKHELSGYMDIFSIAKEFELIKAWFRVRRIPTDQRSDETLAVVGIW